MFGYGERVRQAFSGLLLGSAVACFSVAACSDIRPESDVEEGGMLESPTHEQDALRRTEEHQEEGGHQ